MLWAPQQDDALKAVSDWLANRDGKQCFRLFGYAGTGKTTLAKHFAEGVEGQVHFMAYTGKAAHVLRQKGCGDASTIHSMIYNARDKSRTRLKELEAELAALRLSGLSETAGARTLEKDIARERESLAKPAFNLNTASEIKKASLVIVDECSMVDGRMGEDLLWFGVPVLVLGDPAQLPPVAGGGFFTDHEPDVMLTDIHRQARDNPIIAMATKVREGERLNLGDYGDSKVILGSDVTSEMAMNADQIIVGRNKTRRASNTRARRLLGIDSDYPVHDDKVVCLRNNHDIGILNGTIWSVKGVGDIGEDQLVMDVESLDEPGRVLEDVLTHSHYFLGNEDKLQWWERKNANEMDYGYAITCHKAQGSQYDKVFLVDEAGAFRDDAKKWLYTAITRAASQITIVRT